MARPTEWRRVIASHAANDGTPAANWGGPAVFTGETITRIRLEYRGSVLPAVPFAPAGAAVAMGVRYQPNLSDVVDLDPWYDAGAEEWMWWEKASWRNEIFTYDLATGQPTDYWSFPYDEGTRDIKAQRRVTADGRIWVQTHVDPDFGAQGNHALSVGISVLVLLPIP